MASSESSSSVPDQGLPQWKVAYESALRETDHKTLFRRIETAEAAILNRREILALSSDGFSERQETKAALAKLRNMKKEVLKFL